MYHTYASVPIVLEFRSIVRGVNFLRPLCARMTIFFLLCISVANSFNRNLLFFFRARNAFIISLKSKLSDNFSETNSEYGTG